MPRITSGRRTTRVSTCGISCRPTRPSCCGPKRTLTTYRTLSWRGCYGLGSDQRTREESSKRSYEPEEECWRSHCRRCTRTNLASWYFLTRWLIAENTSGADDRVSADNRCSSKRVIRPVWKCMHHHGLTATIKHFIRPPVYRFRAVKAGQRTLERRT